MDVTDLNFFLAVARTGGVSRATAELLTVQSNVSSRIRALEDELGVPLFRRHARGMALTPSGQLLVPYAERITQLMRELTQVVKDEGDPCGRVSIGSMESTAGLRLPEILGSFSADCPKVDLTLSIDTTDALIGQVVDQRLDGAFVCGPVRHPELVAEPVFLEQLVVVSDASAADLDGALMRRCPPRILVLKAGCAYRARLEKLYDDRDLPAPSILELSNLDGILGCVGAGMGTTLLPLAVVTASPMASTLTVHHPPPEIARAQTLFVRRRDAVETPAIARFLACARQATPREPLQAVDRHTVQPDRLIS